MVGLVVQAGRWLVRWLVSVLADLVAGDIGLRALVAVRSGI